MSDIIAMHRADLVDAVTAAVTPLKAEIDELSSSREWWKRRWGESQARIRELEAALHRLVLFVDILDYEDSTGIVDAARAAISPDAKCPDCGVHFNIKGARHFSECRSQPGAETAEDGWTCKACGTLNHRNLQCRNQGCPSFKNEVSK